ncbi:hypothetical protein [Aureimonas leprariae]|uniref:hypothetical protein n=1 Tax=Plantimonas leprariae TaxID=2615207 RepID=UPI0013872A44|nr:hypothetical protein [Aureimonas leprariae]
MQDTTALIRNLERRITADATPAQAEEWWSLALTIGSSIDGDGAASDEEHEASRLLLWAVRGVIRAMKTSEPPDHGKVRMALTALRRSFDDRRPVAALGTPGAECCRDRPLP